MEQNIDLDALERAAQDATPGPWLPKDDAEHGCCWGASVTGSDFKKMGDYVLSTRPMIAEADEKDAAFIAAANPAVVLALIAQVREQAGHIETLESLSSSQAFTIEALNERLAVRMEELSQAVRGRIAAEKQRDQLLAALVKAVADVDTCVIVDAMELDWVDDARDAIASVPVPTTASEGAHHD